MRGVQYFRILFFYSIVSYECSHQNIIPLELNIFIAHIFFSVPKESTLIVTKKTDLSLNYKTSVRSSFCVLEWVNDTVGVNTEFERTVSGVSVWFPLFSFCQE